MPVSLISPSARLRVVLRPSEMEYDPSTGPRRTKPPLAVRFDSGTATCSDEAWPLLEKHGAYTGVGQPKMVWRADEEERPDAGLSSTESVQVIGGMQVVTKKGGANEPLAGWNATNIGDLTKAIKSGEVTDFSNAIAYEASQRRRRMVMRALADAMGADPAPKKAKKDQAEDVPDTFSAEVSPAA